MNIDGSGKRYCLFNSCNIVVIILVTFLWQVGMTGLGSASESPGKKRPKIGLVLSGGGARGAAHIGVLKVLEKMQIPVDYIAGTSMGSIVGGLYASGMTTTEIEAVVTGLDWNQALEDDIPREDRSFRRKNDDKNYLIKHKSGLSDTLEIELPSGLKQGQNIDLLLQKLTLPVSGVHDFNNLRIPFRAVATDIVSGNAVVLSSGDLAKAMRASMSVPAVFSTVEIDGKLLVDGGVSNNLPVNVVREMGADILIVIDISTPLRTREKLGSTLSITGQLTGILTRRNTEEQIATLTEKDVFIIPDLGDISSGAFDRADEAIPIGVAAAEQKRADLLRLSVSKTTYSDYLVSQQGNMSKRRSSSPVIEFIRLDNQSRISDEVIYARLQLTENSPLDVKKLEDDIGKIYGLELFQNISYNIIEENGKTGLVIQVRERSWGPNYLQAGLAMSGNLDGDSYYDIGLSYSRTAINSLNGEWRSAIQFGASPVLYTEIYQPLSYDSRYFIHPKVLYEQKTIKLYSQNGDDLAEYQVQQYGADLAVGRELGAWGEFRIGLLRMTGDSEIQVGQPNWPDYDFDRGEIYAKFSVDELDDLNFPRNGYSGFLTLVKSDENLGADSDFEQIQMGATAAKSWGYHTLIAKMKASYTVDDDAPLQNRFQLGGLFNLSGFNIDELSGQHMGMLGLAYMRRINDLKFLPTYIGMSLESGNVWEKDDDIGFDNLIFAGSVFLGIDTFLGPVYLGYGMAENDHSSIYFNLGKLF